MDGFAIWVHGYKFECSLHSFACPTRRGTAQEYTSQENQCHAFDRLKNIDRWRVILRLKLRASGFGATYQAAGKLQVWAFGPGSDRCDFVSMTLDVFGFQLQIYPRFLSFLPFLIGFLIPGERLEGQELPQRITSEVRNSDLDSSLIWNVLFFVDTCQAVNTDLQPFPVPAPLQNSHGFTLVYILVSFSEWNRGLLNLSQALRGCCGEPTEHGCLVGETTASPFGLGLIPWSCCQGFVGYF